MLNEIDTTYFVAVRILSPVALFASGLLAGLATLGLLFAWFLKTFIDSWMTPY